MERDALAGTDEKDALGLKGRSLNQRKKGEGREKEGEEGDGGRQRRGKTAHALLCCTWCDCCGIIMLGSERA